jgi:hypothetical protein
VNSAAINMGVQVPLEVILRVCGRRENGGDEPNRGIRCMEMSQPKPLYNYHIKMFKK